MTDENDKNVPTGPEGIRALVAQGEVIPNPLEGLAERAKAERGAPFASETVAALVELRESNRSGYETLVAALKSAGVRVSQLEAAMRQPPLIPLDGADVEPEASSGLIALMEEADFFHAPDGSAFVDVMSNGHRETVAVDSSAFADRLVQLSYENYREPPPRDELQAAIALARAKARYDGPERQVHVRVAEHDGAYYLDLADASWRAVEITRAGWKVIESPPVRFARHKGHLPLPEPQRGGTIELLRKHVSLKGDDDFVLLVGWILAALRPRGPYPLLMLTGEKGSAKSTTTAHIRALLDPNVAALRGPPRDERDLFISATRSHVLSIDNMSHISAAQSDAFCRLATGASFVTRTLFTDADETLLSACRPVVLNAIGDIVARADLADRSVSLEPRRIEDAQRRSLENIQRDFEADRPLILGAFLDATVHGLATIDSVRPSTLPRMADFASWVLACEGALWPESRFMAALERNARTAMDRMIESTPLAAAIASHVIEKGEWSGTMTQLLPQLSRRVDEGTRKSRTWPQDPARLGTTLRNEMRPLLRELDIEITADRVGHNRTRVVTLRHAPAPVASTGGHTIDKPADDGEDA